VHRASTRAVSVKYVSRDVLAARRRIESDPTAQCLVICGLNLSAYVAAQCKAKQGDCCQQNFMFGHLSSGIFRMNIIYRIGPDVANHSLRFEKFGGILRPSRPRQTPKTKLVSLKPRFIRSPSRCVWICIVLHLSNSMLF
jgi:hypothetical protein